MTKRNFRKILFRIIWWHCPKYSVFWRFFNFTQNITYLKPGYLWCLHLFFWFIFLQYTKMHKLSCLFWLSFFFQRLVSNTEFCHQHCLNSLTTRVRHNTKRCSTIDIPTSKFLVYGLFNFARFLLLPQEFKNINI